MKKNMILLFVACLLISTNLYAAENIFDLSWWQKATIEDVKEELKNIPIANFSDVNKRSPLMFAVSATSDPDVIKALLRITENINLQDKKGETALMYACKYSKNPSIVNLLLRYKADVSLTDNDGKTALDYAKNNENINHSNIVSKLHALMSRNNGKPAIIRRKNK